MSVLVGSMPVRWTGGYRTVTGTVGLLEQRAPARPSLRCVVAVGESQTPIWTATEFWSRAKMRQMHRWHHVGDTCNEHWRVSFNVTTGGGSLHIERLFYAPFASMCHMVTRSHGRGVTNRLLSNQGELVMSDCHLSYQCSVNMNSTTKD